MGKTEVGGRKQHPIEEIINEPPPDIACFKHEIHITKKVYWKAAREKTMQVTYEGKPIRITAGFSKETLKARRAWINASHVLKDMTTSTE